MTTGSSSNLSSAGATLQGSFSGESGTISEIGFLYGTSSSSLSSSIAASGTTSPFTATLSGLNASTTYYYQAYVKEYNETTASVETRTGSVLSFTTEAASNRVTGWLELPAKTGDEDFSGVFYGSGGTSSSDRNYSYNYSYSYYGCLWVAYPLAPSHTSGSASTSSWRYNPNIDNSYQVSVNSSSYTSNYNASDYARGHQIPNADRKSDDTMNLQTYYVTNQTPQLQNKFNGSIWSSLEGAVRAQVSSYNDTIYVATGACYQTVGGNETVNTLTAANTGVNPQSLPIPNYYWKALLKVKWGSDGTVTSATAIGFWLEHKEYDSSDYSSYTVSVDEIESKTGFDLFTYLPAALQTTAETNSSWSTFTSF